MNRLLNAIAIVTALSIAQGCTQLSQIQEEPTMNTTTHPNTAHANEISHGHLTTHPASHAESGADHAEASASTQAKLTTTGTIITNTPTSLQIDVQDENGKAIAQFDRFQEQIMHLIAVSDDLQVFQHLHPDHKGNGRFEIDAQFPQAGGYTLFSDYQPTGRSEQVSVLKIQVDGDQASAAQIDWSYIKTLSQTVVRFSPTQPIKAGEEVILQFELQDATRNQPVTDLQPYLGEKGHLVILRQSPALAREDYIHAHAVHETPAHQIHFATRFSQPGMYKLWGQFNRDGEIVTADFWVEVVQ